MWRKGRQLENSQLCADGKSECEDEHDKLTFPRCTMENTFERVCGFKLDDLASFERFTALLYRPTDPTSLGVVRALFGKLFH